MSNLFLPHVCLWKYLIHTRKCMFSVFCFVLLFSSERRKRSSVTSIFCQSMTTPNGIFPSVFWSYSSDRAPSSRNHPTAWVGLHFTESVYISVNLSVLTYFTPFSNTINKLHKLCSFLVILHLKMLCTSTVHASHVSWFRPSWQQSTVQPLTHCFPPRLDREENQN